MLTGDRVVLRAIQREDVPRLYELFEDLEFKYLIQNDPPMPQSLAAAEAEFDQRVESGNPNTSFFVIETDGVVIGSGGLHEIDHFRRVCEIGIGLGREFWGQGFGQDAVKTLVDYAFTHLNMNRVALEVLADDERAVGAYKKAGFVEEGRLRDYSWVNGQYEDGMIMSILRRDWKPS
jgi:RimJ/RimL family protein N-acetyltransferase